MIRWSLVRVQPAQCYSRTLLLAAGEDFNAGRARLLVGLLRSSR
jgi:hypothetical protein